jgi:hypothetical protein
MLDLVFVEHHRAIPILLRCLDLVPPFNFSDEHLQQSFKQTTIVIFYDFNEIAPSKLLKAKIKLKEKFSVCWFTLIAVLNNQFYCLKGEVEARMIRLGTKYAVTFSLRTLSQTLGVRSSCDFQ